VTTNGTGELAGQVALVTGGARRIGRAIALALAHQGATIVVNAKTSREEAEDTVREIKALGGTARAMLADVTDEAAVAGMVGAVDRDLGGVDILVNNAGMSPAYATLADVGEDLYDKVHAVNARGPFRLSVRIGERMAQGAGGSIINVSSVGSLRPTVTDLPYAMAKASLNALTLGLAGAWAPKVRVNAVLPSASETDLTSAWSQEVKARIAGANPMQRLGRPEDIAAVCVFLASDAAGYVNGAQIPVDGGLYRAL